MQIQRLRYFLAVIIACASIAAAHAAGRVTVTIANGRVSLEAHGATLREILDAWARAGQTVVVNAEKIQNEAPLDLSLTDVTEEQALAVLLRPLSGYTATRRAAAAPNVSRFDRIVLLPTSVASRDSAVINNTTPTPAAARPAPAPAPPQQTVMINGVARLIGPNGAVVEDDQQGAPPRIPPRVIPAGGAPAPPPPPAPNAAPARPATAAPGVIGSPTPGVVLAPPPQQRPQPVQR